MDKSTLSNYGWVVVVTLVLAVMLALATPFGEYVGKGAGEVLKSYTQAGNNAVNPDNIETQSKDWDIYLNNNSSEHKNVIPDGGTYTDTNGNTYSKGEDFPETQTGDTYIYGNYKYILNTSEDSKFYQEWRCKALATEEENVTYNSPLSYINGKPVTIFATAFSTLKKPYKLADDFRIPETARLCHMMFNGSTGLMELPEGFTIPDTVTSCHTMFQRASNLKRLPESFSIPKHITDIHWMFLGCTSLENIPASLTFENISICTSAFAYCESLTEIPETFKFPNGKNASLQSFFNGCKSLKDLPSNLTLPENVISIPYLFKDCTSLETLPSSFIIHENIDHVEETFMGCTNLTGTIVINSTIDLNDENGYDHSENMFADTVKSITIKGTSPQLNELAATANNGNVTVG
jgi:hypothetical protein